jgi:foldase protein PrsA
VLIFAKQGDGVNRIAAFLTMVLLIGILAACGGNDAPAADVAPGGGNSADSAPPNAPPGAEPALPLDDDGGQIVATVNGEEISLTEFERAFNRNQLQTATASYDALASAVLHTLVEQTLIHQAAEEMGISISEVEIEAEYQATRALVADDESWNSWLEANLFTQEEFRASLRDALVTQRVRDAITSNDEAITVMQVRARHILVGTAQDAENVLQRLNTGEDFSALAAELSSDVTTREQGGDLGWFGPNDLLTPELADAAFRLEPEQIAGPVETMLGYHVVQTLEFGEREFAADEESDLAAIRFTTWLQSRLDDADVVRFVN